MYSRYFEYQRAATLSDACDILRDRGEGAKIIAGGQSLLPMVNVGLVRPEVVIDISRVPEARQVETDGGFLVIGALNTYQAIIESVQIRLAQPLLQSAASLVGNRRIQNRGTLGGSLAHSDPAAELPLAMTALGATYELSDGRTSRQLKADEFATSFLTTQLAPDEVVVSAQVPVLGPEWGWSFQEIARRRGDFAVVAVAALIRSSGGEIIESRLALSGVGAHAIRLGAVEAALAGARIEDISERVGSIEGLEPMSDTSASASHRRHLARVISVRALEEAFRRSVEDK